MTNIKQRIINKLQQFTWNRKEIKILLSEALEEIKRLEAKLDPDIAFKEAVERL
jgi:hypothetical protein